jgi:transposase
LEPPRHIVKAVATGSSIRQAAARFEVSASTAIKLMQRVRATGSTRPAKIGGYRRPLLDGHDDLLRELTSAKPGITLAEIKAALAERGIAAGHLSTIWTTLRRLGLSHQKSRSEPPSRTGRTSRKTAAVGACGSATWIRRVSCSSTKPAPRPT